MKKNYLALLVCLTGLHFGSHAQWIGPITISPSVPTTNDSVKIYVDCSFPSGSCDPYLASVFVGGNTIYGDALHCLGMLTVICSYTDTFAVAPLPAGNYTFHMQLNAGGGPAPCTAGIVPGPVDSVTFTVVQATGIPPVRGEGACQVFADATERTVTVQIPAGLPKGSVRLMIHSTDGRAVFSAQVPETVSVFRPHLTSGTYVASLVSGEVNYRKKIFIAK